LKILSHRAFSAQVPQDPQLHRWWRRRLGMATGRANDFSSVAAAVVTATCAGLRAAPVLLGRGRVGHAAGSRSSRLPSKSSINALRALEWAIGGGPCPFEIDLDGAELQGPIH
jgi:hypothetical protein